MKDLRSRANSRAQQRGMEAARAFVGKQSFKTDPQGWYTGRNIHPGEKPVQDADDL